MIPKVELNNKPSLPTWSTVPQALRQRLVAQLVPLLVRQLSQPLNAKLAQPRPEVSDE